MTQMKFFRGYDPAVAFAVGHAGVESIQLNKTAKTVKIYHTLALSETEIAAAETVIDLKQMPAYTLA